VDKDWKKDIMDVKRIENRTIALKFVVEQDTFNVIRAYAPWVGIEECLKVKFWEELEGFIQNILLLS